MTYLWWNDIFRDDQIYHNWKSSKVDTNFLLSILPHWKYTCKVEKVAMEKDTGPCLLSTLTTFCVCYLLVLFYFLFTLWSPPPLTPLSIPCLQQQPISYLYLWVWYIFNKIIHRREIIQYLSFSVIFHLA